LIWVGKKKKDQFQTAPVNKNTNQKKAKGRKGGKPENL